MSAERLREAAKSIRSEQEREENLGHIDGREYATWLAVAVWLDFQAEVERRLGGPDYQTPTNHPALAVADAHLGSES